MFQRDGKIARFLLLVDGSLEVFLLAGPAPKVPAFGAIVLYEPGNMLTPIRKKDLAGLEGLWHCDPWWLLDAPRYAGHWARSWIRSTNCAGPGMDGLLYARDLSVVRYFLAGTANDIPNYRRWETAQLPQPRVAKLSSCSSRPHWILDPIWTENK